MSATATIELCRYESAELGDPCSRCGQPFEMVVMTVGETIRGPEPVGPRNLECPNGHVVLEAKEPLADAAIPVFVIWDEP